MRISAAPPRAWPRRALAGAALAAAALPAGPPAARASPGLPRLLDPAEAARLRRIFALQAQGDMAAAARDSAALRDRRLMGHVLADRWQRGAPPAPAELQAWLAAHADHPEARALHAQLLRLLPRGAAVPGTPPDLAALSPTEETGREARDPAALPRDPALDQAVRDHARAGQVDLALAVIAERRDLPPRYATQLQAETALTLFRRGEDGAALRLGLQALRDAEAAGADGGAAGYATGLAAWGSGRWDIALPGFERAARSPAASPARRAAAAFWTARAAIRAGRPALHTPWMVQAAQEPRTFHGLLARRILGLAPGFAWDEAPETAGAAALAETAGGWRALALIEIAEPARAEAELRLLWSQARRNAALLRGMLAAASASGMARLAAQLAAAATAEDGRPRDLVRYPLPRLVPQGGFRVDPALLFGIALQESRFDPAAISPAGARGLMQIMPATASFVASDPSLRREGVSRLHDSGFSMDLAQRYLHHLARTGGIDGDLGRVLAAYNAGPGNLLRWPASQARRADPCLFIEAIPIDETRLYVQQVLANSWVYASRLGLPAPTLDQMAAGGIPRFPGAEEVTAMLRDMRRPAAP